MKQKFLNRYSALSPHTRQIMLALVFALVVMSLLSGVALAARMRAAILCDGGEPNCVEAWNGANLIVYSDNGTTQKFKVNGSTGAVTGFVLQYPTPGTKENCATQTITGTGVLATGLATPQYVNLTLAQDATGDGARLTYTNSSATVTAKVWNTALTPAAATTPVTVSWCAVGVP
jgi:hypothetical protein